MPFPNFIDVWQNVFRRLNDARMPNPADDEIGDVECPKAPALPRRFKSVGVWAGNATLANPTRDIDFCKDHNINRIDIVVNDHSAWRSPRDFTVRSATRLGRVADLAHAAGIEVHLMSWCMPHEKYIRQAASELIPLAEMLDAKSLQWDAEEPWTRAKKRLPYAEAAMILKESFEKLPCSMGINGIGYASTDKLGPLAAVCDYIVPQAYATAKNGMDPKKTPIKFHNRWRDKFNKPVVVGLAAYRQKGMKGYTEGEAIAAGIEGVKSLGTVDTVIYWSLFHIRKNPQVAKAVKNILAKPEVA